MSHQEFFQELKKDHRELINLLNQMKSHVSQEQEDLIIQLKMELTPHQEAEEKTFYRALEENQSSYKIALKGEEEHHVAEAILKQLEQTPRDARWDAKLEVLDELVQEHIREEESKVFTAAKNLEESEIDNILRDFQRTKLQIKSDIQKQSAPEIPDQGTRSGNLPDEDLGTIV